MRMLENLAAGNVELSAAAAADFAATQRVLDTHTVKGSQGLMKSVSLQADTLGLV
ncbi:hypothetical protein AcV5_000546 [Taiwanofungus camphoratus]|nr:hypothetical protein AcV5_000546 [Antrodia cinnamomea]